jgi:hypothetical protein
MPLSSHVDLARAEIYVWWRLLWKNERHVKVRLLL